MSAVPRLVVPEEAQGEVLRDPCTGRQHRLATTPRETVGLDRLRAIVAGGESQASLARRLGVSSPRMHRIYMGIHYPDAEFIARACVVLGIEGHLWGLADVAPEEMKNS